MRPRMFVLKIRNSKIRNFKFNCQTRKICLKTVPEKIRVFLLLLTVVDEIFEVKCFEIERRTEFHYWFEKRAFVDLYEIKMQFETTRSRILLYIDST